MDAGDRMSPGLGPEVVCFPVAIYQFSLCLLITTVPESSLASSGFLCMSFHLLHEHSTLLAQFIHLCIGALIQHKNFVNTTLLSQKLANKVDIKPFLTEFRV